MICAAPFRERVVHHAIVNVLGPSFEAFQIHDSYACRAGKGTQKALLKAFHYAKSRQYCLKLDIRKYYDTVDHEVLNRLLARRFKDGEVLALLARLIATYETSPRKGLPIGNLTSQHFANFYLAHFDHFVKDALKCHAYLRYMDDMLVFSNNRAELVALLREAESFLSEKLDLSLKYAYVHRSAYGIPFLGFLVLPDKILLAAKSKRRFLRKMRVLRRALGSGHIDEASFAERSLSLCAATFPARARAFRRNVLYSLLERGPSSGDNRVKRGGSWNNDPANLRASNRDNDNPWNANTNNGFRVLSPAPSPAKSGALAEPEVP